MSKPKKKKEGSGNVTSTATITDEALKRE